jgi:hypothetical protein
MYLVLTNAQFGCGFFPRQKLDNVQAALRTIEILVESSNIFNKGGSTPASKTKSRHCGLSPAMLPNAQTAFFIF